jgi:hypothetical protein
MRTYYFIKIAILPALNYSIKTVRRRPRDTMHTICFLLLLGGASADFGPCNTDLDCNLNGQRTAIPGNKLICICFKPWTGDACASLGLAPVPLPSRYGMTGQSPGGGAAVWGGAPVYDKKSGLYHLFTNRITNGCPLSYFTNNSRIDHSVSSNITGPYEFQDVAIPVQSTHNYSPIRLADGSFAMFHIGYGHFGDLGPSKCNNDSENPFVTLEGNPPFSEATQINSTIHVAAQLAGPWTPLQNNTFKCTNPVAPWVHKNGSLFVVCDDDHSLYRATSIHGPWTKASTLCRGGQLNNTAPDSCSGPYGPQGHYEDGNLYQDARQNWHMLYHVYDVHGDRSQCVNSTVSAHLFSLDALTWHTSTVQPYTTQVDVVDTATGNHSTMTVSTRERPMFSFNDEGVPTHLWNGVCSAPSCPDGPVTGCVDCKYSHPTFNMVQPLYS